MTHKYHWLYVLCFPVLLLACQENTVYHSFQSLPQDGWSKGDTLLFSIPRQQVKPGTYRMDIELRYRPSFAYRSLWMVVYQNKHDSLHFEADTIQCPLITEEGKQLGNGLTNYYQQHCTLTGVRIDTAYTPQFRIAHYLRNGRLEGISDVGIKLYRESRRSGGK